MFIAKNNDLIILAKETREELEQALQFMVYTSIEETDIEYKLYDGVYLTKDEIVEKRKEEEIAELKQELDNLDLKTVRPLRAINNGTATDFDVEKLNSIEQQAKEIRERIAELSNCII